MCMASANFLAYLCNQQVVHELTALEILTLLLENPTDDSVEVAIGFLKECGLKLSEVAPKGMHGVYDSLRASYTQ
ncbi:pre-mRNA-splicing factor CWC22 homolog [Dysidea avara]|uniref:pre-mRNA-splicing factor CWC22 homolog n=1 Tax=Dysidea avara TaxID=196820 RepID=UPI0033292A79